MTEHFQLFAIEIQQLSWNLYNLIINKGVVWQQNFKRANSTETEKDLKKINGMEQVLDIYLSKYNTVDNEETFTRNIKR